MSSVIANEFSEAVNLLHTQALIEVGLVLFFITLILNILARLLVWWVGRRNPQEARV
jgi:phosphate transport system permease protein